MFNKKLIYEMLKPPKSQTSINFFKITYPKFAECSF